jgi:hypothetical protein
MGAVFSIFAGLYYWFEKLTGVQYSEFLTQLHFWVFFVGVNITFFPNARVLGLVPRVALGYFGENLGGAGAASSLLIDGAMKFEITQGTGTRYLDIGTSLSIGDWSSGPSLGYFTFYANFGLFASFPTLLN